MVEFVGPRHVGWGVKDPIALAKFYQEVMGMEVVSQTPADAPVGLTLFLSRHPEEGLHHDLVFFANPMFAHTAFEVASLADLLKFFQEVKGKGVPITFTFNHGFWLSFYFNDPEGHSIEIFWRTGAKVPNDWQVYPIDLERTEEDLMREVTAMVEHFAGGARTTAAEWNAAHAWNPSEQAARRWGANQPGAGTGSAGQQGGGGWPQGQPGAGGWNQGQPGAGLQNAGPWGQGQTGAGQWNQGQPSAGQWGQGQQPGGQPGAGQWGGGDWNKRVIDEFRANGGKVANMVTPVLLITTTGRKSGQAHTTPVGYLTDADRLIVVPSSPTADWYLNALADAQVKVELGAESFTATVTPVEGEQRKVFLEQARRMAAAAASTWRPSEAGTAEDHVPTDGPVVALQRVG